MQIQSILLAGALLAGSASALPSFDDEEPNFDALVVDAAQLELHYGKKSTTGAKVDKKLSRAVRSTLNRWAPLAREHGLEVAVSEEADVVFIGAAEDDVLVDAARWADETWELFEELLPPALDEADEDGAELPRPHATTVFLFDRDGFASDAWPALLDEMAARLYITKGFATAMAGDPGSFTVRRQSIFVQNTYDMAGDAGAGDDEFRLGNEIAHKTAQYLVEDRFGRQPDVIRWGVGYVAEWRLFESAYQFNAGGFVASESHFGWPEKTHDWIKDRSKSKRDDFSLTHTMFTCQTPGTAEKAQQAAWGVLDHLLAKEPEDLAVMLDQLGRLHAEEDPRGESPSYEGEGGATLEACSAVVDELKTKTLLKHLKKLK